VFSATLVVYIGQLVVSYHTYQQTNNTIQMQLKIDQLEQQLKQNKETNANPKAVH
jgi:aminoglycoside phosphotransferase family enzyme